MEQFLIHELVMVYIAESMQHVLLQILYVQVIIDSHENIACVVKHADEEHKRELFFVRIITI